MDDNILYLLQPYQGHVNTVTPLCPACGFPFCCPRNRTHSHTCENCDVEFDVRSNNVYGVRLWTTMRVLPLRKDH